MTSPSIHLALLALCGSTLVAALNLPLVGHNSGDAYQKINNYLCDHEQSQDPETNMHVAEAYLDKLTRDGHKTPLLKRSLVAALRDFVDLRHAARSCDSIARATIERNNANNAGKSSRAHIDTPRRVDLIVQHYFRQHAQTCAASQVATAVDAERSLGDSFVAHIDTARAAFDAKPDVARGISEAASFEKLNFVGTVAYDALVQLAKEEPGYEYLVNTEVDEHDGKLRDTTKQFVAQLFQRHIAEPCTSYVDWLQHTAGPAVFDATTLDESQLAEYGAPEFVALRRRFEFCTQIKRQRAAAEKRLVKLVAKRFLSTREKIAEWFEEGDI